jgi:hypothetical protein
MYETSYSHLNYPSCLFIVKVIDRKSLPSSIPSKSWPLDRFEPETQNFDLNRHKIKTQHDKSNIFESYELKN